MSSADIVYKSFILPIFDYCDVAWNSCGKGGLDSIEKTQRRAARVIAKTNYNKDIIERKTRQSNLLHLTKVRTESAKKSFYYNGCTVFNQHSLLHKT